MQPTSVKFQENIDGTMSIYIETTSKLLTPTEVMDYLDYDGFPKDELCQNCNTQDWMALESIYNLVWKTVHEHGKNGKPTEFAIHCENDKCTIGTIPAYNKKDV